MYGNIAWVPVSSGTQVQPEVILDPDYLSDIFPLLMTMLWYKRSVIFIQQYKF